MISLGHVIEEIYKIGKEKFPGEIYFEELKIIVARNEISVEYLIGTLSILYVLGLINFTNQNSIRASSKQAHFALGSLAKYCNSAVQVVDEPIDAEYETRYLVELTNALESTRKYKNGLDKEPLHERSFVNILVKGNQIRNGWKQNVYLHIYHPKWQAYHLVGIGYRKNVNSLNDMVCLALEEKLGLLPRQYELDSLVKIDNLEYVNLSKSLGVITKYNISIRVLKKLNINFNLLDKIKSNPHWNKDTFRWFTIEEINQGYGQFNEAVMQSSAFVFKIIDSDSIPVSVENAKDIDRWPKLKDVINYKFTKLQQYLLVFVFLLGLVVAFQPSLFVGLFYINEAELAIYANYAQIIGTIISLLSLIISLFIAFHN